MSTTTNNNYEKVYVHQRHMKQSKTYACISYIDEPSKYSIVELKRVSNIDDQQFGTIKEMGKSYHVRVEQSGISSENRWVFCNRFLLSGSLASMEKYGSLLERATSSQMHEEVPSDCEDWYLKFDKQDSHAKSFENPKVSRNGERRDLQNYIIGHCVFLRDIIY